VRAAAPGDVDAICAFLTRELAPRAPPAQWRRLFNLPWTTSPDYGHILEADGAVVGYAGAIVCERMLGGRREAICNLTSWCVAPAHRAGPVSLQLLTPYLRRTDWTITNLTPVIDTVPVFEKLGFITLDTAKQIFLPLTAPRSLSPAGAVLTDPDRIRDLLQPENRQLFDDHVPLGCGVTLVARGRDTAFLITKRRIKRKMPLSEVLYCSNPRLTVSMFERVKLAILRSQRSLALVADSRIFGDSAPRHVRYPLPSLFRSSRLTAGAIDSLYSELAVLPI